MTSHPGDDHARRFFHDTNIGWNPFRYRTDPRPVRTRSIETEHLSLVPFCSTPRRGASSHALRTPRCTTRIARRIVGARQLHEFQAITRGTAWWTRGSPVAQ